jgi:hypothetical protein
VAQSQEDKLVEALEDIEDILELHFGVGKWEGETQSRPHFAAGKIGVEEKQVGQKRTQVLALGLQGEYKRGWLWSYPSDEY